MAIDDIDIKAESLRVAEVVAAAKRNAAAKQQHEPEGIDQLGGVDVDLCLSLNDADATQITAEADAIFSVIDADGDGLITRKELGEHLAGQQHTPEAVDRIFRSLDVNDDGGIEPEELRAAFFRYESANLRLALGLAAGSHVSPEKRLDADRTKLSDELFDALDSDGNEVLSSSELTAHLQSTGFSRRTIGSIFNVLDLNQDGKISREEFRHGFARYEFSSLRLALGFR